MFGGVETEQTPAVAAQDRRRGQHLGIQKRPTREQPMEEPAVPVGPFHHRRNTEASLLHFLMLLGWHPGWRPRRIGPNATHYGLLAHISSQENYWVYPDARHFAREGAQGAHDR